MHVYRVFHHSGKGHAAVKDGFSWPGFLFTAAWALSRRMWMASIPLILVWGALIFLIRETFESDPFLGIIAVLVLNLIVGAKGNTWRMNSLYDRGYTSVGRINARGPQDAVAKVAASGGIIPPGMKAVRQPPGLLAMPRMFRGLFAVIGLTWKAAFRYRLFWVVTALLLGAVIGLPLLLHDDGTASGFAQILITYTLGAVTALLGLCTLWLACGTLARDVEECQMQVVAVKPIARWQIWLGKWLGLVSLNAALLALAGVSIYSFLQFRAKDLPAKELAKLKNEVLVARGSAREENHEKDIENGTEELFQERLKKYKEAGIDLTEARQQLREQVKAVLQVVPPDAVRFWVIHLGAAAAERLKDQPLSLRVKFNSPEVDHPETYHAVFYAGVPQKTMLYRSEVMSLAPDTFHEFTIPPNLYEPNGDLTIAFRNVNDKVMLFPLDEGMEVLYREATFAGSFARGLGIILCWMSLLAALGLAASSYLSFPVAAFLCVSVLVMGLSSGTLSNVVEDKTIMGYNEEKGTKGHSPVDVVAVPFFHAVLDVINVVQQFSPIDSLSTGRDVTWAVLMKAVGEVVLMLGGVLGLIGIFIFSRRELATAQGTH